MNVRSGFLALRCLVLLSVALASSYGCNVKEVRKIPRSHDVQVEVLLDSCKGNESPAAIWMDRNGRAIKELGVPLHSQRTVERATKAYVSNGRATVIIGTMKEWVRLTIDASKEAESQKDPHIPILDCKDKLIYRAVRRRRDRRLPFSLAHPELSEADMNHEYPFESLPFVWDVREVGDLLSDHETLQKSTFSGAGLFYWRGTKNVRGHMESDFIFSTYDKTGSGMVTLTYTQETPDKLVLLTQVGRNVEFYPKNTAGAFESRSLLVSQNYGQSDDYVPCYNSNYRCEVNCFGATGNSNLVVTIYKLEGQKEKKLVSVHPMEGEDMAQVSFPVLPEGDRHDSYYKCTASDTSGKIKSRIIRVNFYLTIDVLQDKSEITHNHDGSYDVLCVVEGFPFPEKVDLVFVFKDGTKIPVSSHITHPKWSITETRGTLPAKRAHGDLRGVQCTAKNQGGGSATTSDLIKLVKK